jgi:hypothetical protein
VTVADDDETLEIVPHKKCRRRRGGPPQGRAFAAVWAPAARGSLLVRTAYDVYNAERCRSRIAKQAFPRDQPRVLLPFRS